MEKCSQFENVSRIKYAGLLSRCFLAVISSHLIVSYQEKETFLELLYLPAYYKAFTGSALIAFFVIEPIYQINHWLGRRYVWEESVLKRLKFQSLFGVLFPFIIAVSGAAIYFAVNNIHINKTDYFDKYPLIIGIMIALLNAIYIGVDVVRQNKFFHERERRKTQRREEESLLKKNNETIVPDALLFFYMDKNYFYIDRNGEELVWIYGSLEETYKILSKSDYFLVNRTDIVHRDNIMLIKPGKSHRKKLFLRKPEGKIITTSQGKTSNFLKWWAGKFDDDLIEPMP